MYVVRSFWRGNAAGGSKFGYTSIYIWDTGRGWGSGTMRRIHVQVEVTVIRSFAACCQVGYTSGGWETKSIWRVRAYSGDCGSIILISISLRAAVLFTRQTKQPEQEFYKLNEVFISQHLKRRSTRGAQKSWKKASEVVRDVEHDTRRGEGLSTFNFSSVFVYTTRWRSSLYATLPGEEKFQLLYLRRLRLFTHSNRDTFSPMLARICNLINMSE